MSGSIMYQWTRATNIRIERRGKILVSLYINSIRMFVYLSVCLSVLYDGYFRGEIVVLGNILYHSTGNATAQKKTNFICLWKNISAQRGLNPP